ncbi:MAG: radical SAM family heme chaperone HemW, partial [Bacteroidota bacterium]|nr:radical SAM family heme chaperone HemW [Bacteroidota bacterium]
KGEESSDGPVETLYLGGGTPSLLSTSHLEKIINAIHKYFSFQENSEWTIECNPDDLNENLVKQLRKTGFNRLSIGIQSFHNRDLKIMRRSHSARQAEESVRLAASGEFDRITVDLIYGIPGQSIAEWEKNIDQVLSLPLSHLSAYHLTFEPGTVFDHWKKKRRLVPVPEENSLEQYRILREKLLSAGFEHYELSNFGLGAIVSKHNMLYWTGQAYLGLGPSAHSFDGKKRSWNISSLKTYMDHIASGKEISESEDLSGRENYHDYLISSLRTKWGADPAHIELMFGKQFRVHFEEQARTFIQTGSMMEAEGKLIIEPGQWLITDHILRALFMD